MPAQSGWGLRVGLRLSQWDERRLFFIRVRLLFLLNVVLQRIGLIIVPTKSCILRRIVENRGIIIVRVCTRIIRSSLLSQSSRWTLSIHVLPLDRHHVAI